jgi:hypothetical protein
MIQMLMLLDLLDAWNPPVTAEVMIRRETVEVRCRDHLARVADRDILREPVYRCWRSSRTVISEVRERTLRA